MRNGRVKKVSKLFLRGLVQLVYLKKERHADRSSNKTEKIRKNWQMLVQVFFIMAYMKYFKHDQVESISYFLEFRQN